MGNKEFEVAYCVEDPLMTRTPDDRVIAAQCCRKNPSNSVPRCARFIGTDPDGCVADKSFKNNDPPMKEFTYGEAKAECAKLSDLDDPDVGELDLCEESCNGAGCGYGKNPVWTKIPCSNRPPPSAPPPPEL